MYKVLSLGWRLGYFLNTKMKKRTLIKGDDADDDYDDHDDDDDGLNVLPAVFLSHFTPNVNDVCYFLYPCSRTKCETIQLYGCA
jgi:hypothetical protein